MGAPLYIFLDESGNLDFSAKGTKYWSLTALCTTDPTRNREALSKLGYALALEGNGVECFHATEDRQVVRDKVFEAILGLDDNSEVHCVLAEKRKTHPSLYTDHKSKKSGNKPKQDPTSFYNLVCRTLLRYILNAPRFKEADSVVIVLSAIFNSQKHSVIEAALKAVLKTATKVPFRIYFWANKADLNCQIADYCGWAIYVAWERNELRPRNTISKLVMSQFDLFGRGNQTFYE